MFWIAAIVLWLVAVALVVFVFRRMTIRQLSLERLEEFDSSDSERRWDDYDLGFVSRWLFRAGFRRRGAVARFCWATAGSAAVAALGVSVLFRSGIIDQLVGLGSQIPGGVSDLLVPLAYILPWFLFAELAAVPWLLVRTVRRTRVTEVEQDLPLLLDLLATLSEAGLSFDAAVDRVVATMPRRWLPTEMRIYQAELLAGRPRVSALRRLAWRLDVTSVTTFVSAVIHAEQVGAGMTVVLRSQADDQRQRRREKALALALSTPVKLIPPMIVCFLPGIFVISLGPIFYKFFEMADGMLGSYGL